MPPPAVPVTVSCSRSACAVSKVFLNSCAWRMRAMISIRLVDDFEVERVDRRAEDRIALAEGFELLRFHIFVGEPLWRRRRLFRGTLELHALDRREPLTEDRENVGGAALDRLRVEIIGLVE